jgi:hypothetical protein
MLCSANRGQIFRDTRHFTAAILAVDNILESYWRKISNLGSSRFHASYKRLNEIFAGGCGITHRFTSAKLRESQTALRGRQSPQRSLKGHCREEDPGNRQGTRSGPSGPRGGTWGPSPATPELSMRSIPARNIFRTSDALRTFVKPYLSGEVGPQILWNK